MFLFLLAFFLDYFLPILPTAYATQLDSSEQTNQECKDYGEDLSYKARWLNFQDDPDFSKLDPTTQQKFIQQQDEITDLIIDNRTIGIHSLTKDYYYALKTMDYCYRQTLSEFLTINYSFIPFDPYARYWCDNIDADIPDKQAANPDFVRTFNRWANNARSHPAFSDTMDIDISTLRSKLLSSTLKLRKRFLRLCQHWVDHDDTILVPNSQANVKTSYRQGEAFLRVLQNHSRCPDGLNDYFSLQERKFLWNENIEDEEEACPFGARLAKVFLDYKLNFLDKHRIPGSSEEAVTAPLLLRQRMIMPLGLPENFNTVRYPHFGRGVIERYTPSHVMYLFLRGGKLDETVIPPYSDPQTLVNLVRDALQDPLNKNLTLTHFSHAIYQDATLRHYCADTKENKYYNPSNLRMPYKDATIKRVLQRYGYLLPILGPEDLEKEPILVDFKKPLSMNQKGRRQRGCLYYPHRVNPTFNGFMPEN